MKDNKLIAEFMGWYIDVQVSEDYPNQEWHTSKLDKGNWDSSKCVHLDEPDVKKQRDVIDSYLWDSLCGHSYGRCGKYTTSWYALMPVVEKIASIQDCTVHLNLASLNFRKECYIEYGFMKVEKIVSCNDKNSLIVATYDAVVKFINWYNEKLAV